MEDSKKLEKNNRIKLSMQETLERRKSQVLKVFELKVNCHHTSKEAFNKFHLWFKEAKWILNDVLSSENSFDFDYEYKDHRTVSHYDKDKNKVFDKLTIQTGIHQRLIQGIYNDICNLSKAKKKGLKIGKLKFKKEVNCIPLKTGMLKVKGTRTISIPGFSKLKVYGLEQFINKENYEIADAKIIRKATGIYIKATVMLPKSTKVEFIKDHAVGLDFGIKDNITDSDGNKYNFITQESEQLKFLQKQLHKKQKGSKRYWKLRNQIQREYEHLKNKRNDDANQFVSKLRKENDKIYFQDESLSNWRKFSKGFARKIQWGSMGRIKAKLVSLEKEGESFKLDKWFPSTQLCPVCHTKTKHKLSERNYNCICGYTEDRDVHAAKNILKFGRLKLKAECLEQASIEDTTSSSTIVINGLVVSGSVEMKTEATAL